MAATQKNSGCLGALIHLFLGVSANETNQITTYPYRMRDDFLSAAELSLYHVLTKAVGNDAVILAKVRLADLFFVQRPNENRGALNRIAQRHIDFLVCQPHTMRPLLGIELDDASHTRAGRVERDEFLNEVFSAARLPILRIKAQQAYNVREIGERIRAYIGEPGKDAKSITAGIITAVETPNAGDTGAPPICPKCGEFMVLRTSTKGAHHGETFYGCPNYPRCRTILPCERAIR